MSDGALVVVDVIEGVSPQTYTVIKQAWNENVRMCLILNKIDRLIIERGMEAQEIYMKMAQIVEQVNSIVSELIKADIMAMDKVLTGSAFDDEIERQENIHLFQPEKGNVAFSSAYDCWAFNLPGFVPNIAQKLGMNPKGLLKFMWGQFYYNATTKNVTKQPVGTNQREMFVQFILEPIVEKYRRVFKEEVMQSTNKIREGHLTIKEKLQKFMPVEAGVFKMVIEHLPSPCQAQAERYLKFCPILANPKLPSALQRFKNGIMECNNVIAGQDGEANADTVVFITKMQPFSARLYDITIKSLERSQETQRLVAISRVFSGKLHVGQKVFVMGPRHQINGQKDI
mmetsp:Transcript_2734/g.4663  ORF Transcript_2734/g.4663 Transcript_2734/m.4663 type:complete len:342 (+) Transcript_2734:445-1470(+)